jgi:hypothetical protein
VPKKTASSQAAWALLTEGVTSARIEAHRLRHLISRVQKLVEQSTHREHIEQIAGDILLAVPKRLDHLEIDLDRTALALIKMGEEFLDARLPLSDKVRVEEAVMPAFGGGKMRTSVDKLAQRWLRAGIENGKLDKSMRQQANRDLERAGLDGNGRFQKIGQALSVAFKVLEKYGIDPDEVLSADRHRAPSGTWPIDLAFSNPEDSFSPVSIRNSVLHFAWTDLGDKYEVVAYLS